MSAWHAACLNAIERIPLMSRFTHILCPVDFSDVSQHALDHAAAIAQRDQARLTVLYVFANLPSMDVPPLVLSPADRERILVDLRRMCAKVAPSVQVDYRVLETERVDRTILSEQTDLGADLLVLGTHGRSGLRHMFLGSVTEKVIRKAACPTLVVPPRAPNVSPTAPVSITRMLCPVDFSEISMKALAHARAMAREVGARVTVIAVVNVARELRDSAMFPGVDVEALTRAAETETRRRVSELFDEGTRTIDAVVVAGSPAEEILKRAADDSTDLIVMGVHGRGAVDLRLFGSTTHQVVRSSACPVLIVPE
jgi:nucleotide-binding universal stress UspA family protein